MAAVLGLRRSSLPDSQGEEDESIGSPSDSGKLGKKLSLHQQLLGSRSRPVLNNHECVLAVLIVIAVSLLLICARFPPRDWDLAVSAGDQSVSASAHPKLRNDQLQDASYNGQGTNFFGLRSTADVLARKSQKNIRSMPCAAVKSFKSSLGDGVVSQAYHSPKAFYQDFLDMVCRFKIFVYPHSAEDPFANIFRSYKEVPTGNYASEHFFKMALLNSDLLTEDPTEADLFFMPFSIANMRNDKRIGVPGIKHFVKDYVSNISVNYPYWDRSGGADHFYVNCHSIGKTATDEAFHVRISAIQVVCSSSYHIPVFYPHKDATIPQVWPRSGFPKEAPLIKQRQTLAFFAGAGNSPIRALVAKHWSNDSEIKVYSERIKTPYDMALLTSKYCLHVKGFEVNTARLADAMHYGCVPIIIADYHDLPFNDVLDWRRFSLVVTHEDIPRLKDIIKAVSDEQYVQMQANVMQVRQHFQWHKKPKHFDAFYTVMYELWVRRHVARFQFR
jgi:hypothetical protein